jgi:isopentenyl diphosphate isomerase/L-lactate dehydrogenase-like FMN-dependent dehydrogenase
MADDSLAVRFPSIRLMREAARARLPKPIFDFADGGAEDEVTLRRNESAFLRWNFLPRPLEGAATRDQSVTLFGHTLSSPVLIGPTGLAGLFWPQGEIASARAAAAASTVYCQSHGSVCSIEDLAAQHDGMRWMQVFIYRDRAFTRELTQRARDAGCQALVLTIDNQLLGQRERDLANGFSIPPRFSMRQSLAMTLKWQWAWSMRRELRRLTFGNYVRAGSGESLATLAGRMGSLLDPAMNWDDVAQLRAQWHGPLLLKGVLHPADAQRAVTAGIDGLIVSNHGGRQIDGASSALEALPAIVTGPDRRRNPPWHRCRQGDRTGCAGRTDCAPATVGTRGRGRGRSGACPVNLSFRNRSGHGPARRAQPRCTATSRPAGSLRTLGLGHRA